MAFNLTHRHGDMSPGNERTDFSALLRELDDRPEDEEHNSVAVTHESEWCLSVSRGGYVVLEHLEDGGERHMRDVPASQVIALWRSLAAGNIAQLEAEPWIPSY